MKLFTWISGAALCLSLTQTASAQVRVNVEVDALELICSLLPQDMQQDCYDGLVYSDDQAALEESNRALVGFCQELTFSSERSRCMDLMNTGYFTLETINACRSFTFSSGKIDCLQTVRNNNYQSRTLELCANQTFESEQLSCLQETANNYYGRRAMKICANMTFSSSTVSCLKTIKNKEIADYLIEACENETFDSEKINCLERYGRQLNPRDGHRRGRHQNNDRGDVVIVITPQAADTCEAVNSNGNSISGGRLIAVDKFLDAAAEYARENNSCVIAERQGVERSSVVLGSSGQILGRDLSQKRAGEVRNSYGYSRCLRAVCR